jgi:hypothetical protein|tara:strand:- start:139 stop:240 length:102 start_codon:yes stop_codon:yes gene_type:complete
MEKIKSIWNNLKTPVKIFVVVAVLIILYAILFG